jgi:hypothetical protein
VSVLTKWDEYGKCPTCGMLPGERCRDMRYPYYWSQDGWNKYAMHPHSDRPKKETR